ncbi:MAG: hypothetical protein LBV40_07855, partial [Methanomicrobiales archaeon]|nr:hypothetical protein [Methanomicrobiales archaeon]
MSPDIIQNTHVTACFRKYLTVCIVVCLMSTTTVFADTLPKEIPETQIWTATSAIDVVGVTMESTSLIWNIGDAGLEELPPAVVNKDGYRSGSIAYAQYKESITSNGGQISEVKSFSIDTGAKTNGLSNIKTEKVLTYTSQNGSHLMGDELYILDIAGNWASNVSDLVCVFAQSAGDIIPAFCNKVTAKATLQSITTAQIESIGSATLVGSNPAALNYEIAVMPNSDDYANGVIATTFTVSVREGRTDVRDPLAGYSWVHGRTGDSMWELYDAGGNIVIQFMRGGINLVSLWHQGVRYWTNAPSLTGNLMLTDDGSPNGRPLPSAAQITVNAGSSNQDPYTFTYQGAAYTINPHDSNQATGVVMTKPHFEYDKLASSLTAIDSARVSGKITQLVKEFHYQSGI